MADEMGTETTRADVEEQDSTGETEQDQKSPEDAKTAEDEAAQSQEDATEAGGQADADEDAPADGLKVVVSIKGGRATIGVQQPSSDPHIETFDSLDESALTQEVAAVIERARARWEESPKHPAYARPTPPARRRNRRQQGTAQGANAEGETEAETQQQTLRLF